MAPVTPFFRDARIVLLGEASHGDGEAFVAKIRLVAFLHRQLGFDLLVFESGLYDCEAGWRRISAPGPPARPEETGLFGLWAASRQVAPLLEYLDAAASSSYPLVLAGLDPQLTSRAGQRFTTALAADAGRAISPESLSALDTLASALLGPWDPVPVDPLGRGRSAMRTLALDAQARHAPFWRQVLHGLDELAAALLAGGPHPDLAAVATARDRLMAENLLWLLSQHPRRKVIVWTASVHAARRLEQAVRNLDGTKAYTGTVTLGDHLATTRSDAVRTAAVVSYDGSSGIGLAAARPIAPAPAGSLEARLADAGLTRAFVDVRGAAPGSWLDRELVAAQFGHALQRARWADVLDGFYRVKTMRPNEAR